MHWEVRKASEQWPLSCRDKGWLQLCFESLGFKPKDVIVAKHKGSYCVDGGRGLFAKEPRSQEFKECSGPLSASGFFTTG